MLCLLLSAGIWLIHNLSQNYVSIVSVPVIAESNIDGRAHTSITDDTISAQVKASGFKHFGLARTHKRPRTVYFSPSDFRHEDGNIYSMPTSSLYKYAEDIFDDGVSIESFVSESPRFAFPEVTNKRVPVRTVHSISFYPQYMATGEMSLQPDSVLVYGEPSKLEYIDNILTQPIELRNLRSSVHGEVELDVPSGVRLSAEEVIYSLDVSRFVEIRDEVKVGTRNVPSGVELSVLPSTASVVYKCVFPVTTDPTETTEFYVDYRDFSGSITGRCIALPDGLPSNVISYSITPSVFDCIVLGEEKNKRNR